MQIILDPEESKAYQDQKIREAILEQTSRFPADTKLPEGCRRRPTPLSDEQKAEIQRLYETGMERGQIARELHLPGRQVSGAVQAYINAAKKLHVEPETEELPPNAPIVSPETESPATEATCTACGSPLGRDKVAIDGKLYCGQECAPAKVPPMVARKTTTCDIDEELLSLVAQKSDMNAKDIVVWLEDYHGHCDLTPGKISYYRGILTKRAALKTRQDRIDEMILAGVAKGQKYTTIASEINDVVGGCMMPNHVAERLAELRGDMA